LAVVGYGNKTYGTVIFEGKTVDIYDFFKRNNIKPDLLLNAKLQPADLTPRRLIRFYRHSIQDYLNKFPSVQTYLFKKYCLNKNEGTRSFIYPGFEHLANPATDLEKVNELLLTYTYLDQRLGTRVHDRIVRVLVARGFVLNKESLL